MNETYRQMQAEFPELRQLLGGPIIFGATGKFVSPFPTVRPLTRFNVMYGIQLAISMILNAILRALDPNRTTLREESTAIASEILSLAKRESQHRPLGASYIPLCLVAAWGATEDQSTRDMMGTMLAEYQTDFVDTNWLNMGIYLKNKLESLHLKYETLVLEQASEFLEI
jgi:hypothetical protein